MNDVSEDGPRFELSANALGESRSCYWTGPSPSQRCVQTERGGFTGIASYLYLGGAGH